MKAKPVLEVTLKTESFDVAALLGNVREALSVKRVFGDPIDQNGTRVIPVARVRGGGGGGGGTAPEGEGAGSGAGFGMTADPAGAFVIVGGWGGRPPGPWPLPCEAAQA